MPVRCRYVAQFAVVLGKQIEIMDRNGGGSMFIFRDGRVEAATPGLLTLTAIGRSFGSHGCRQISFPFKFAPQKIDADSELISDRKGNSEIM
jgi:hypothetical protein